MFLFEKVMNSLPFVAAKIINGLRETRGPGALDSFKDEACEEDFNTDSKETALFRSWDKTI